jgi:hypothetical protein
MDGRGYGSRQPIPKDGLYKLGRALYKSHDMIRESDASISAKMFQENGEQ